MLFIVAWVGNKWVLFRILITRGWVVVTCIIIRSTSLALPIPQLAPGRIVNLATMSSRKLMLAAVLWRFIELIKR